MRKALFLSALLFACGGDDTTNDDGGGLDATTKDVAPESATKDATTDATSDAKADVASDAPIESASDAGIDVIDDSPADVTIVDASGCDGGCTMYSFECSNAVPACQCVGVANGQKDPVCDAAAANCLIDPCLKKTVQCIADQCVIK
jgi:hypothetical protein